MIQRLSDWKTEMGAGGRDEALRIRRPLSNRKGGHGVLDQLEFLAFCNALKSELRGGHALPPAPPRRRNDRYKNVTKTEEN